MNDNIHLNISHIAVLRKSFNDSNLRIEYEEIDIPVSEKTDNLFQLLKQDFIPDEELILLLKSNLEELKSKVTLNYCPKINESYQGIYLKQETIKKIENLTDPISGRKKEYIKNIVKDFLQNKKDGKTFNKSLKKVKDLKPKMYSHRFYGWHSEYFEINNDFNVRIESNFGFGSAGYFYTILIFKGIHIVPYSEFVDYKFAQVHEIIRYSKKHYLIDEEWIRSFNYIIEATSSYYNNQEDFVQKYIIDECEKLVNGIEWIQNESIFTFKEDKVIRNKSDSSVIKFEKELRQEKYSGRRLKLYRAEKTTGALNFINNINNCKELFDISSIVKRIEILNHNIEPMLVAENNNIILELKHAEEEYDILIKKLEAVRSTYEPNYEEYNRLKNNKLKLEMVTFLNTYPNFGNTETEYNDLKKNVFSALSYIEQLKHEKKQIEGFIENQKKYFN